MKQRLWLAIGLALLLSSTSVLFAKTRPKPKFISSPEFLSAKSTLDTVFFDNFETEKGWTNTDMAVQPPYWHIDTYNAYAGHSFWCGTNTDTVGWVEPPGYGDGWAQFLISPEIDLSSVTADSIILNYWQNNRLEAPDPGDDWDCINVWVTTVSTDSSWNFDHWNIIYPDTFRFPGTGYNVDQPYSWKYIGLVPDGTSIPGWGGIKGWHQVAFNLSAYKGQKIKLAFIGTSDAAQSDQSHITAVTYHGMWYLDNIAVDTVSAGGIKGATFFEDCEGGMGQWYAHGKVPQYYWHKTTRRANSPTNAWWNGTDSTGVYKWGQSDAVTSPIIDLSEVRNTDPCYVDFKCWLDIPDDGTDANGLNDWYKIETSADSGRNWVDDNGINIDSSKIWTDHSVFYQVNLANYIGKTVMIRVGVGTDGDTHVGEGMYIDDFIIWGKTRDILPPPATILLVDNDGNAVDLAANSWTKYMEASISNLGYRYSLATIGSNKVMTPGYLEQFPVVIWNLGSNFDYRTGPNYRALTAIDQENIMAYLDNGGKLWMSGQYYFFANGTQLDTTVHPNLWMDYLHLAPENGWAAATSYRGYGVTGDPIGDGLSDSLLYDRLNGGYPWTGPAKAYSLNPDTPAVNVAGITANDDGSFNGLRYQDAGLEYQFVYTAFPFEAVSSQLKRDTLASRVIQWLIPGTPEYMPPAVPTGLTAVQQYDSVICAWNANSEPDLAGYNVYRALQVGLPVWVKIGTVAANSFVDKSITDGAIYHYAVTAFDDKLPANESVRSSWFYLHITSWKGVEGEPLASSPRNFSLGQNNPNPFNRSTDIQFALPAQSRTRLVVYNITGQQVRTLVDDNLNSGYHNVTWNGRDQSGQAVANGIYFYRMEASGSNGQKFAQTKRLNLVK